MNLMPLRGKDTFVFYGYVNEDREPGMARAEALAQVVAFLQY
jgi:hypothetical protein